MSPRPADHGVSHGVRRPGASAGGAGPDEPEVHRITSAPEPHSADLDRRMGRYLWQMGIRTACFIGAFFATGWLQWVLLLGAIVLPYIAVVLANNGTVSNGEVLGTVPEQHPALASSLGHVPSDASPDDGPVQGVVVVTRALPSGTGSHTVDDAHGSEDQDQHEGEDRS